nr:MAG TPA: hypothetical protein [Caudoviricetes sp.]
MNKESLDILSDYEELCGRLSNIFDVLELAIAQDEPMSFSLLATANQALEKLMKEHTEICQVYRRCSKNF